MRCKYALIMAVIITIIYMSCAGNGFVPRTPEQDVSRIGILCPVTRITYCAVRYPDIHMYLNDGSFWYITCNRSHIDKFIKSEIFNVPATNVTTAFVSREEWKRLYKFLEDKCVFIEGEIKSYERKEKKRERKS